MSRLSFLLSCAFIRRRHWICEIFLPQTFHNFKALECLEKNHNKQKYRVYNTIVKTVSILTCRCEAWKMTKREKRNCGDGNSCTEKVLWNFENREHQKWSYQKKNESWWDNGGENTEKTVHLAWACEKNWEQNPKNFYSVEADL